MRALLITVVALLSLLGGSEYASAQKVYKWVDKDGNVQFTQSPPPEGTPTEARTLAATTVTEERSKYCRAIAELAQRIAYAHRAGTPISTASDEMRRVEVQEGVRVEQIALRELVTFVYASDPRRTSVADISGRAQDACTGGSFGNYGRTPRTAAANGNAQKPAAGPDPEKTVATGTGWVTSGLVATNYHVIKGSDHIRVRFTDGRETTAFIGETDPVNDVALLRVGGTLPPGLPLADDESPIGAEVFTLGYPHTDIMGKNAKLSMGIISATSGVQDDPRLYQISVPLQSGNSGGPLVNSDGAVVGLVSSKLSAAKVYQWTGDLPENVNYAVKVAFLKKLLEHRSALAENQPTQPGTLENLAARIGPSVVLVIAE